jgi:hypothetical protein
MTPKQLQQVKDRFDQYTRSFASENRLPGVLRYKYDHTQRVAENARVLAKDLGWATSDVCRAEATGWLHDIGRFSQFRDFGCFHDAVSVDHGQRGRNDLRNSDILEGIDPNTQTVLLTSVRYHNIRSMPENINAENLRFLKLIRDADKLDIYQVVENIVRAGNAAHFAEMLPGLDLQAAPTPAILDELRRTHTGSYAHVRSFADMLLIQLCWVYQLNYAPSYRQFRERNIIERYTRLMPSKNEAQDILEHISKFLDKKTREHAPEMCTII